MVRPAVRLCIVGILCKLADVLLVPAQHDGVPAVNARNAPNAPPIAPLSFCESCDSEIFASVGTQEVESLSAAGDIVVGLNLVRVLKRVVERLIHAVKEELKHDQCNNGALSERRWEPTV